MFVASKSWSHPGKDLMSWRENIFLPVLFKPKGSFIQFVPLQRTQRKFGVNIRTSCFLCKIPTEHTATQQNEVMVSCIIQKQIWACLKVRCPTRHWSPIDFKIHEQFACHYKFEIDTFRSVQLLVDVQVLYDLDPQKKPVAFASITLSQAHVSQIGFGT